MADYEDGIFSNLPRPRRRPGERDDDDRRLSPRQLLAMNFVPEGPLPERPRPSSRKGGSSPSGPHAPVISAAPVVTGNAAVGQTLTCSTGTWLYVPTGYTYQWLRDGTPIAGATSSTYVVVSGDLTHAISCTVTATNATGNASATSNAVTIVSLPANTAAPVASGSLTVGSTLSCTTGTWTNSPTSYAYQWQRGGVNIAGATSSTYTTVTADGGTSVTCVVTASNAGGGASATSNALAIAGSGMSAQSAAYLARTVGGNEGGNGANIATLIDGLVADGVWAKLDALYVLAQQNATDALLNLVGTNYSLTQTGSFLQAGPRSGSIIFTSYVGFSGWPTFGSYFDTGFNPSVAISPQFVQNSASFGVWAYNVPIVDGASGGDMGNSTSAAGLSNMLTAYTDGVFYCRINAAGAPGITAPVVRGLYTGDRSVAANLVPYVNGVAKATQTSASVAPANVSFRVGDIGGAPTENTLSAAFIGASLGAAGQLALYNRLRTYMTAVGVP